MGIIEAATAAAKAGLSMPPSVKAKPHPSADIPSPLPLSTPQGRGDSTAVSSPFADESQQDASGNASQQETTRKPPPPTQAQLAPGGQQQWEQGHKTPGPGPKTLTSFGAGPVMVHSVLMGAQPVLQAPALPGNGRMWVPQMASQVAVQVGNCEWSWLRLEAGM